MKKLLLIFNIVFLISSCSTENENLKNNSENENLKNSNSIDCFTLQENSIEFLSSSNCYLTPINPISSQLYLYNSLPASQCFGPYLKSSVFESVFFHLNAVNPNSVQKPLSRVLITAGYDTIYLSQIIDTNDIYPMITAQKANIVVSKIICKYYSQIQDLYSTNPITGARYNLYINYIGVDHSLCGATENAYVNIGYSIYKESY